VPLKLDIKIIVATHKKYWMPSDPCYLPLHVGREGKEDLGYIGDNTGDNISVKNPNFCELTGIYWAWKNLHADYIGLCHYRRYFAHKVHSNNLRVKQEAILSMKDYDMLLRDYDCILPTKRNYYIETVRSQYEHTHNKQDLDECEKVISKKYPEYIDAFKQVIQQKRLHILNMFVMKWDLFDAYCQFLFGVLFELEKRIDITNYNQYEARVYGFIAERLLNVWVVKKNIVYKEEPVVCMEKINWLKKGGNFLKRKFIGK
jgi:hypothetical protein